MLKGITLYFLIVISLLSKDGLSLAFNSCQTMVEISVGMGLGFDDSLEEDSTEDLWHDANHGLIESLIPVFKKEKVKILYTNSFLLKVHVEHVGPPPQCA
jgi:hypothetical protein